jgi:AcrR family transcriptional regulator
LDETCGKVRPRQRIVDTATGLFRKHGIRGIGVDAIAEAAGTNKMTLYRHFGSKDELVAECLRLQADKADQKWSALEEAHPGDPRAQLLAWIRLAADYVCMEGQGCDLANTAVELHEDDHPARAVIEAFKVAQRNRLASLCSAAGADDPDLLADTLSLLLEGARISRQSVGPSGPCARFVRAAEAAVAASTRQVATAAE